LDDGRPKGFALVVYQNPKEVSRAIRELHDSPLDERNIIVKEWKGQDNHHDGGGGGGNNNMDEDRGGGGGGCQIYVGNLSYEASWQDLKDFFRQCGNVENAEVIEGSDGRKKGFGIVRFRTEKDASFAIRRFDGFEYKGRKLEVRFDRRDSNDGGGRRGGDRGGESESHGGVGGGCKLFVGNISFDTSWQDLKDYFRQCGDVDNAEVIEGADGKKKGFGIVRFKSERDANNAISRLDGVEFQGRNLVVRFDRRDSDGGGQSNNSNRRGGGESSDFHGGGGGGGGGCKLFVGNLSFDTSWQDLKDYFRQCGDVDNAEVIEGADGRKKGFGIVRFSSERDANNAIRRLDGVEFQGRNLEVRFDRRDSDGGGPPSHSNSNNTTRHSNEDRGGRRGEASDSRARGSGGTGAGQLFVGNLSFDASWQDLKNHFRQCGDVDDADVIEGADGRKKGFGIVRFRNEKDAESAISRLDGVEFQGRKLEVRLDKRGGGGGSSSSRADASTAPRTKKPEPEMKVDREEALGMALKSSR
jgi:RNA recognition motif-containing protein